MGNKCTEYQKVRRVLGIKKVLSLVLLYQFWWVQLLVKTSSLHYPQCNLTDITRDNLSYYMQLPLEPHNILHYFFHTCTRPVNTPFKKHLSVTYCSIRLNVICHKPQTHLYLLFKICIYAPFSLTFICQSMAWIISKGDTIFINSISSNVWNLWSSNREIILAELNQITAHKHINNL